MHPSRRDQVCIETSSKSFGDWRDWGNDRNSRQKQRWEDFILRVQGGNWNLRKGASIQELFQVMLGAIPLLIPENSTSSILDKERQKKLDNKNGGGVKHKWWHQYLVVNVFSMTPTCYLLYLSTSMKRAFSWIITSTWRNGFEYIVLQRVNTYNTYCAAAAPFIVEKVSTSDYWW